LFYLKRDLRVTNISKIIYTVKFRNFENGDLPGKANEPSYHGDKR